MDGTDVTDIRVHAIGRDLATYRGELEQPHRIAWSEEIVGSGTGEFVVPHDDPALVANPAMLERDAVLVVRDADNPSWPGWPFLARRRARVRGDVWDPITVVGPGVRELLNTALVEYARGFGVGVQSDERPFGWMAVDYDDSQAPWVDGAPYDGGPQSDPVYWRVKRNYPAGWPVPEARWVSGEALDLNGTTAPAPWGRGDGFPLPGHPFRKYCYLRDYLVGPYVGEATLLISSDSSHDVYLNGQRVAQSGGSKTWQTYEQVEVELSGDDVLAIELYNGGSSVHYNPGEVLWALVVVEEDPVTGEQVIDVLFHSQPDRPGMRTHPFTDTPPGVTLGEILATLHQEAVDRGWLPIGRDFTRTHDSTGVAWPDRHVLVAQVGNDSVLTCAERWRSVGAGVEIDVALSWVGTVPTFTFRAFVSRGQDRTATVTVPLAQARELQAETEDEVITALAVRTADRWFRYPLDGSPTDGTRRELFVSLGLQPTNRTALGICDAVLSSALSESRLALPFVLNSAQPAPLPYVDWWPGDLIGGPKFVGDLIVGDWGVGPVRPITVAGKVDNVGDVDYVVEVDL